MFHNHFNAKILFLETTNLFEENKLYMNLGSSSPVVDFFHLSQPYMFRRQMVNKFHLYSVNNYGFVTCSTQMAKKWYYG